MGIVFRTEEELCSVGVLDTTGCQDCGKAKVQTQYLTLEYNMLRLSSKVVLEGTTSEMTHLNGQVATIAAHPRVGHPILRPTSGGRYSLATRAMCA